jgi:hypothetical protein
MRIEIEGLPELIRALRNNANVARPLEQAFEHIGLHASSASKRAAPVDVGKLRGSITYEVDRSPLPGFVRIGTIGGSKVGYAAYMEYGTGMRHDHPSWPRKPHIVPYGVLEGWVARKGRHRGEKANARRERLARVSEDAAAAAVGIMRRGGLEPRRYLRGPFEGNRVRYVRTIAAALRKMSLSNG